MQTSLPLQYFIQSVEPKGVTWAFYGRGSIRYYWVRIHVVTRYFWGAFQWRHVIAFVTRNDSILNGSHQIFYLIVLDVCKFFWYFWVNFVARRWASPYTKCSSNSPGYTVPLSWAIVQHGFLIINFSLIWSLNLLV